MRVTISGATGFIGRGLVAGLLRDGHTVYVLTRRANTPYGSNVGIFYWDPLAGPPPDDALNRTDAVIHLAGEPVAQRWTAEAKHRIRESRVASTRHLVQGIRSVPYPPPVLICASAVGYYGFRGDEFLTEQSTAGTGFLPEVCQEWEREADAASDLLRVAKLRIGMVLGKDGGALALMSPAFKAGIGGRLSNGRQWMSWIHHDDVIGLLRHALDGSVSGPINGVAPNPVTNREFTRHLAAALHRPAIFPVPAFAVKALFGEMAEIVLGSQRILPKVAEATGYRFQHPELAPALRSIFG
ncbi:MAG: TIGR01777 family oxidoreductase [Bryobacteraceae bacterium]